MVDVVFARLDGRPHRILRAAFWVRILPWRVARKIRARRDDRARLNIVARNALLAYATVQALTESFNALHADYYGTGRPGGGGAGGSPAQDRRRRIEESGLRLVKGGES